MGEIRISTDDHVECMISPQQKLEMELDIEPENQRDLFCEITSVIRGDKHGIFKPNEPNYIKATDSFASELQHVFSNILVKETWNANLQSMLSEDIQKLSSKTGRYETAVEADSHQFNHLETKMTDLTYKYKYLIEDFFFMLDKIRKSEKEILQSIRQIQIQFRHLSKATSYGNFTYWISEICTTSFVSRYVGHPKAAFVLATFAGAVSIFGSLAAFSYAKRCTEDISKLINQNRDRFKKLESIFSSGNSTDKALSKLFPYGINEDLLAKLLQQTTNIESETSRRQYLYILILASNIKHDAKLLLDDEFLMSVKLFVESPASQMWYIRMQIRQLMNSFNGELEYEIQTLGSCKGVFQKRVQNSFLPITVSLISNDQNKLRGILCGFGAFTAAYDALDFEEHEFEQLRSLEEKLQDDYRKFEKIWVVLNEEFD